MKTSVTMVSVGRYFGENKIDIEGFIKFCRDIEVDGVDLCEYYWKDKKAEIERIPLWLKENNLALAVFAIGNEFTVTTAIEMKKQVNYVKQGIDTALRIGVDKVRIFGGYHDGKPRRECMDKVEEGIEKCLPYAEKNQVTLVLENHGDMPGTSKEILGIIEKFKSPYFKCTLDIGNFIYDNMAEKEDPISATKNLVDCTIHCHVKDFRYSENKNSKLESCVVGEGIVPVKDCLKVLKDYNYKEYISLEFEGSKTVDDLVGIKRSIQHIKKIIKRLSKP